jgi:hypothetical protein
MTVPDDWDDELPEIIANRDLNQEYSGSRIPRELLK